MYRTLIKIGTLFLIAVNILAIPFANAEESDLSAVIQADTSVEVNRNIIFDASSSFLPDPEKKISYEWDFGDGNKDEGIEVVHTYPDPFLYNATLTINDGERISVASHEVHVYRKLALLITDKTEAAKRISGIKNYA